MVSLKLVAVACVLALAYANPTSIDGGLVGNVGKGVGSIVNGVTNGVGQIAGGTGGTGLVGVLEQLLKGVGGATGNVGSILKDVLNLKIPGTVDDVLNTVIGVVATVGGVLNKVIPGVGTNVSNLVTGIVKYLICILGSPGLTKDLIGDSRAGYNNSDDIPAVCKPGFGSQFGVQSYNGSYSSPEDLIKAYGLDHFASDIESAINKYTNGEGVDSLEGSKKQIAEWLLQLAQIVKDTDGKISKQDAAKIIVQITIILGGIGNSCDSDGKLGNQIAEQFIKYITSNIGTDAFGGVDLTSELPEINSEVSKCSPDGLDGAVNVGSRSCDS